MTSIADEVDRLAAQRDAGRLSDAEFEAAKARLFAQPAGEPWRAQAAQANATVNSLRRSTVDRWIGGVCGGIAKSTGIDSWIVRLLFTIAVVSAGIGLLPYVLLWIFIPLEGR
jgi:phage shock protein PspC (stress-responsive transcriptional regulator)